MENFILNNFCVGFVIWTLSKLILPVHFASIRLGSEVVESDLLEIFRHLTKKSSCKLHGDRIGSILVRTFHVEHCRNAAIRLRLRVRRRIKCSSLHAIHSLSKISSTTRRSSAYGNCKNSSNFVSLEQF